MKKIFHLHLRFIFSFLSVVGSLSSAFADSSIELVQSVPLETTLAVPTIRHTQEVWLAMIRGAQRTIDLEEFYIESKPEEALEPVLSEIQIAAARGVYVRILVDAKFYKNYSQIPLKLSKIPNIEVKTIDFAPAVQHAKFFVVDDSDSYVGSANFDWLALSHIHEVGLHVRDPSVSQKIESVFERDWERGVTVNPLPRTVSRPIAPESASTVASRSDILVMASPPSQNPAGMPDSLSGIIRLIDSAQISLKIQQYQYSLRPSRGPGKWLELDSAIRRAARRGVSVQILVDAVSLKAGKAALEALASLENIQVRTVKIPEWSGGRLEYARLIHSKYFTVDGAQSWVGTENWTENYFTDSRNIGMIVNSTELTHSLDRIFNQVWESSYTSSVE